MGLGVTLSTYAQSFKPIEVDFPALGYAFSGDAGKGIQIPIEARYNINDKFSVGLQWQWALMVKPSIVQVGVAATKNMSLVFDYYKKIGGGNFRPFIGIGCGYYSYLYIAVDTSLTVPDTELALSKLGVAPRIGFEYKHLRMMAEYNIILGSSDVKLAAGYYAPYNPSYFAIKMALTLGGGRKD